MKIAIVNHHISRVTGGSEHQCDLIARELISRGHDVHYVAVGGHNGNFDAPYLVHNVDASGIQIARLCRGIRPDIVYWRFNKRCLFTAARTISKLRVPIIFAVSHVADTEKWASKMTLGEVTIKEYFGVVLAKIVSRWNYQGFKYVDGVVVNNSTHLGHIPVPRQLHISNSAAPRVLDVENGWSWPRPYCVWIANIKQQKQPELFVRLAERLDSSGMDFLMFGKIQADAYRYLEDNDKWPRRFHYLGSCDIAKANSVIGNSLFVVHTCKPEGFPNVFIQAWSNAKPVVSLCFDPEQLLTSESLGYCSGTFDQFVTDVNELIKNVRLREEIGLRARTFASKTFDVATNVGLLEHFIADTLESYWAG